MVDDGIPRSILLAVLILAGGLFAGAETAFSYCNRIRMRTLADSGNRRAKSAVYVLERFDQALVTILVGTNVISVAAASLATIFAVELMGASGSVIATVVLTILVFIFSETIPKSIARANSDSITLAFAGPLKTLMLILSPVCFLFSKLGDAMKHLFREQESPSITEDEFQDIVSTVGEEGIIEPEEEEIIHSAIQFGDLKARDVMVPLAQVVMIKITDTPAHIKELMLDEKYSRIPVCDGNSDHIIGIVQTSDCLLKLLRQGGFRLRNSMSPAYMIQPDIKLAELFEEMSRRRTHIAVVASGGHTRGIVTMEDVLEEIVGEIYDEDDTAPTVPGGEASPA